MNDGLTQLGNKVEIPESPDQAKLESITFAPYYLDRAVPRPMPSPTLRFVCPEFTSLCPVTGQPDFGNIIIDYIPDGLIVESKSLKLFLGSFRLHKAFHEQIVVDIGRRVIEACKPEWIRVTAFFNSRGGIGIHAVWQSGQVPPSAHILPLNA